MNRNRVRYSRTLSKVFEALLSPSNPGNLNFLIRDVPLASNKDPYSLDVQIREGDKVMLYHGATRVLVIRHSPRKRNLPLSFSDTNKFYKALPEFSDMTAAASEGNLKQFRETYIAFLRMAIHCIDVVQPRWYRKEGFWQNRLACRFGTAETPLRGELKIIDREAVLGFDNREQKRAFYGPILDKNSRY